MLWISRFGWEQPSSPWSSVTQITTHVQIPPTQNWEAQRWVVHLWASILKSVQAPGWIWNALRYLKHLREAGRYDKGLETRPLPFCKSSWRPGRIFQASQMTVDNDVWARESSPEPSFLLVPKPLAGREISHHCKYPLVTYEGAAQTRPVNSYLSRL